jgi:hypothetical protein
MTSVAVCGLWSVVCGLWSVVCGLWVLGSCAVAVPQRVEAELASLRKENQRLQSVDAQNTDLWSEVRADARVNHA